MSAKKRNIYVTKSSGDLAPFDENKLMSSLKRSGANTEEAREISDRIQSGLYEGISTRSIYRNAFGLLRKQSRHYAARYNLKKGIMQLGPSGYPFEKFIGELLAHQGYKIKLQQLLDGKCVTHEIDVVAETDHHYCIIECKYHNQQGIMCDVKIPLYINSRYRDVVDKLHTLKEFEKRIFEGWVVTNTQFTTDAIKYGTCAGLKLIGWDYPAKGSLKEMIDTLGLYPVTCLTSLTAIEKQRLLDNKIVLCKEINHNVKLLQTINVPQARIHTILTECEDLCRIKIS